MISAARQYSMDNETNNFSDLGLSHDDVDYARGPVQLSDPELVKITRLRLLTDRGFPAYDISYCWGEMKDGSTVLVDLGVHQLSKKNPMGELIEAAKKAGRFAKGLGLLDRGGVWSILT